MSLTISESNNTEFEKVPAGTYVARCFKLIDLGTQRVEWQGNAKLQKKIMVSWEILDEDVKMEDGRPFAISKRYTASLYETAQLRIDLEAWRGRPFTDSELANFDLHDVLGAYAMVQIVHVTKDGRTYANMNAIMSTKEKPAPVNPDVAFDIDKFDAKVFETFSDRMKETIQASEEWAKIVEEPTNRAVKEALGVDDVVTDISDEAINLDDIPF